MAISEWRRGQIIGCGSTATVSLAAAYPSGDHFAVKTAELSLAAPLQWEYALLSTLRHPNVVACLGSEIAPAYPNGHPCFNLFLELAPLGALSDQIKTRGGRLQEPAIRSYASDILRGLAHLHANFIAHCDVKSRNVLIWPGGRAKLADFGCARPADGTTRPVAGTPAFMAPEAARGEEQSAPADIWALGCTVVEMATGRPPWSEIGDPVAVLRRVGFTVDVPECPSWLSDEAKDFLSRCLRRDPRERWTAEQLLRHPFVAKQSPITEEQVWVSPKSTLEQGLWDSEADEEEQEEEEGEEMVLTLESELRSAEERIRGLAGDGVPAASNWAWDENWITVRASEVEPAMAADPISLHEDNSLNSAGHSDARYRDETVVAEYVNQIVEHKQCYVIVFDSASNDKKLFFFHMLLGLIAKSCTVLDHFFVDLSQKLKKTEEGEK